MRPAGVAYPLGARGLALVKAFEGLRLTAYRCPAGIWTVGYGSTGPHVAPGTTVTAPEAEALLLLDLQRFQSAVARLVRVPLTEGQYDALVSFTFNLGEGALQASTLRAMLNRGEYAGAADQFDRWVLAGGVKLPGLVRRRAAERALFCTDDAHR